VKPMFGGPKADSANKIDKIEKVELMMKHGKPIFKHPPSA